MSIRWSLLIFLVVACTAIAATEIIFPHWFSPIKVQVMRWSLYASGLLCGYLLFMVTAALSNEHTKQVVRNAEQEARMHTIIGNLIHALNNRLTVIIGGLELAKMKCRNHPVEDAMIESGLLGIQDLVTRLRRIREEGSTETLSDEELAGQEIEEEPTNPDESPTTSPSVKKNILVVDDEAPILRLVSLILQGEYEVTTTQDAVAALQVIEQGTVDLLVTDWNMPGVSGLELARQARKVRPHLPIIMATARMEELIEAHGEELIEAMIETITKPYRAVVFKDLITTLLA